MENNSKIATLHQLLDEDAGKFTYGEILLKNKLPLWIDHAESLQLKQILRKYLDIVQSHVLKMEEFFATEKFTSLSLVNRVMQALIDETIEKLANCADTEVSDACLLASIQSINHYKISRYGTAAAFAKDIELLNSAGLFHEMEVNEKNIDDRLSQLAKYEINEKAKKTLALPK